MKCHEYRGRLAYVLVVGGGGLVERAGGLCARGRGGGEGDESRVCFGSKGGKKTGIRLLSLVMIGNDKERQNPRGTHNHSTINRSAAVKAGGHVAALE